jgi:hypothetical protein
VRTDRLPPVLRQRLRDGIRVVSMPAADALVGQYRVQASQSATGPPVGVPVP